MVAGLRVFMAAGVAAIAASPVAAEPFVRTTSGCTADATTALIRGFVRDYDHGRVAAMNRVWAPEPYFQWFSAGRRSGSRAYDRASLAAYFDGRVRTHERIRLLELGAGYDPKRNIVNFAGRLVRSADDLQPVTLPFKGAAACRRTGPSLIVWSM
jgi:hypothetical protein